MSNGYEKVVIKLGLIKQGEEPVFRRIPYGLLELEDDLNATGAVDKLKKYAILMFEGRSGDMDTSNINFDDYTVALMYKDTDDDNVLIFTDYDVVAALKEYSATGKVKILAEVSKNKQKQRRSKSSSASTQTFVFSAEKTTQVPATFVNIPVEVPIPSPSPIEPDGQVPPPATARAFVLDGSSSPHLLSSIADLLQSAAVNAPGEVPIPPPDATNTELPPSPSSVQPDGQAPPQVSARAFVLDGSSSSSSPHLLSSIADLLQSAAKAAVAGANSIDASNVISEVLKNVDLAAAAVEEKAKATNEKAQTKLHDAHSKAQTKLDVAQNVVDDKAKKAVRNTERAARQAARIIRKTARKAHSTVVGTPRAPDADTVAQETAGGIGLGTCPTGLVRNNAEFVVASDCTGQRPEIAAPSATNPASVPLPATPPVVAERPFIHGRHTCDQCLTTPIVGKRYHATNLKDYDLCENCYNNYKGSEIQFEEAFLDRDVPFQGRWHARRARWTTAPRRCGFAASTPVSTVEPTVAVPVPPPAPQHPPNLPPCGRFTMKACANEADDIALKEAIRRSLEDQKKTEEGDIEIKVTGDLSILKVDVETVNDSDDDVDEMKSETKEEKTAVKDNLEPSENDVSEFTEEPDIEVPPSQEPKIAEVSLKGEVAEPSTYKSSGFSFVSDAEGVTAQILGATLDKMAEAIDGLNWELDHPQQADASIQSDDEDLLNDDGADEHENNEGALIADGEEDSTEGDSASHDSWQMVTEADRIARAAQALGSALFNSDMQNSHENVSATSGLTNDSGRTGLSGIDTVPSAVHSIIPAEATTKDINVANDEKTAVANKQLPSRNINSHFDERAVMNEIRSMKVSALKEELASRQVPPVGFLEKEDLVRALFEVRKRSADFSTTSSVPEVQMNRWFGQLQQLHELGFMDDAKNIDILESLTAANIGVDADEEVSVEQVIDAMMHD